MDTFESSHLTNDDLTVTNNDKQFSLENLSSLLLSKNYKIVNKYTLNNLYIFLKIFSIETGDNIIVSIPSSYPIYVNNDDTDNIHLIEFTDIDENLNLDSNPSKSSNYSEIKISELEDDKLYLEPEEVDRLMSQYQEINLNTEQTDKLKKYIINYKQQLDRLKLCTKSIKYKFSIFTDFSFCVINRLNKIDCYTVKKSIPSDDTNKELCISIDIENFYENIDTLHNDIINVYKNLYNILGETHLKQHTILNSRLKQYQNISELLRKKYLKKTEYDTTIKKLEFINKQIKIKEQKLTRDLSKLNTDNINITTKSFKRTRLEEDNLKLLEYKASTIKLLSKIKKEYNTFMLDFDFVLFDNIRLLNIVSNNFIKLGVLEDCKKL